jgi:hypothetical protein
MMERDGVEKGCINPSRRAWILAVEVSNGVRGEDIVGGNPHVLPFVIALPFY